jgi:hypothetical protein
VDTDTPNPFLLDPHAVDGVQMALDSLIKSNALVVALDTDVASQYSTACLVSLAKHLPVNDNVAACRAVLFEVGRHIAEHVPAGATVLEEGPGDDCGHTPEEHKRVTPDADLITASGSAWYSALIAHDWAAADNVLKAVHRTVPRDRLPMALTYIGTVSVVSLGASLRLNMIMAASEEHECGPECENPGDV